RVLYSSHSAKWSFNDIRFSSTLLGAIKEARYDVSPTRNIIVFNNGCWAEGSCCQEFVVPRVCGTSYGDHRADIVSSCQRLPGSKYLIFYASPRLIDVSASKGETNKVCPDTGNSLRAWRYSTSYSGSVL
ncbi:unnamed protein product, partial [Vitrella brassicaformis CCMP3155]